MKLYEATAEAGAGVIEGGEPPPVDGASPTPQEGGEAQSQEEQLPFGEHPRWKKQLEENRSLKGELQKLKSMLQQHDGAIRMGNYLRANPKIAAKFFELINGEGSPALDKPKEDPYKDYDPDVAAKFREMDEIKAKLAEKEKQEAEARERTSKENQEIVDKAYYGWLQGKGYLDSDGNPQDEITVKLIDAAVLAGLKENCRDPKNPTKAELDEILEWVEKGVAHLRNSEKKTVLKQVANPKVPPATGSKSGNPPPVNKEMTDEDYIADIEAALG